MSNAHTPAPWLLNADAARHEPGFYGSPSEPGDEEVYTSIHIGANRIAAFIKPADARLIIAAPDLLAAVKAMDNALCDGFDTQATRMTGRKVLISARAAIAKAEGK